jgi:hypothetical protein
MIANSAIGRLISFASRSIGGLIGTLVMIAICILVSALVLGAYAAMVGGGIFFFVFACGMAFFILAGLLARVTLPPEDHDGTVTIRASRRLALESLWFVLWWCAPLAMLVWYLADKAPIPLTALLGFFFIVLPAASVISAAKGVFAPVRLKSDAAGLTVYASRGIFHPAGGCTYSWSDLGLAELRTIGETQGVFVNLTGGRGGLWLNLEGVETCPDEIVGAINRRVLQSRPQDAA